MSRMPGKICYICGRSFGTASIGIHQKQCLQKREKEQARLPKRLRTKLRNPDEIAAATGMNENDAAFTSWKASLAPCTVCGRTFLPDRLAVHQRSCRPSSPAKAASASSSRSPGNRPTSSRGRSPRGRGRGRGRGGSNKGSRRLSSSGGADRSFDDTEISGRAVGGGSTTFLETDPTGEFLPSRQGGGGGGADDEQAIGGGGGGSSGYDLSNIPDDAFPADEVAAVEVERVPCSSCGRKFVPESLAKHERVCQKVFKGDSSSPKKGSGKGGGGTSPARSPSKARSPGSGSGSGDPKNKTNWRAKHEEFIRNVRAARKVDAVLKSGGDLSALPPPEPSINPDYVQCPHCSRRFNETAAQRHIPRCATTENRPAPPPSYNRYAAGEKGTPTLSSSTRTPKSRGGSRDYSVSPASSSPSRSPGRRPTSQQKSKRVSVRTSGGSGGRGSSGTGLSASGRSPGASARSGGERRSSGGGGGGSGGGVRLKFCGECGAKPVTDTQKFCGECGTSLVV